MSESKPVAPGPSMNNQGESQYENEGPWQPLEAQIELLEAELSVLRECLVRLSMIQAECEQEGARAIPISVELQALGLLERVMKH